MCPGVFTGGRGVSRLTCVPEFPSMDARRLLRVLMREPLAYRVLRQNGSHRWLVSDAGYPAFTFAYHDRRTVSGLAVRKVLMRDVGLTEAQALSILGR
jgi:predicted RNA binding protein YcfA (HicA-like mRNA interferase family)